MQGRYNDEQAAGVLLECMVRSEEQRIKLMTEIYTRVITHTLLMVSNGAGG